MEWSNDQKKALDSVAAWFNDPKKDQVFSLTGYAGTGKTTLIQHFREGISGAVCHAAFTGKAALQMRKSGATNAQTIHSLIYMPNTDENEELVFDFRDDSPLMGAKLLILDEVSMVDKELGEDVLSFGVPTLVIGDPGQLPPVKGAGYFNRKPNAHLDTVHRQALDSPILRLATDIRKGKILKKEECEGLSVYKRGGDPTAIEADQTICGKNAMRVRLNNFTRKKTNQSGIFPNPGEKIIFLRNNQRDQIFNGLLAEVTKVKFSESHNELAISANGDNGVSYKNLIIHPECFSNPAELEEISWRERKRKNEATFGYAITCHKAQGSQWDSVLVVDDRLFAWDKAMRKRWLYTAITRAAEKLTIVAGR